MGGVPTFGPEVAFAAPDLVHQAVLDAHGCCSVGGWVVGLWWMI